MVYITPKQYPVLNRVDGSPILRRNRNPAAVVVVKLVAFIGQRKDMRNLKSHIEGTYHHKKARLSLI